MRFLHKYNNNLQSHLYNHIRYVFLLYYQLYVFITADVSVIGAFNVVRGFICWSFFLLDSFFRYLPTIIKIIQILCKLLPISYVL